MSADAVASGIEAAGFSTEALPPLQPVAARTSDTAAPATQSALRATPLPPAPPATLSEAARVPAPARSGTPRPAAAAPEAAYVQAGLFSSRENAEAAGRTLRSAGLVPTIRENQAEGRRTWRVVVGPAPTASDRAAVLETVRGAGFGDAYAVSR
jgi:cell division protein FtsN